MRPTMCPKPIWFALSVSIPLAYAQTPTPPSVTVESRDALVQAVASAGPGSTILIAPGTYEGGLHFDGLRGVEGKPIILAGADPSRPPVFQGRNSGFHFTDPAFVELRHLVVTGATGNGINIDDGGSYDTPAHHVVLQQLTIRDIGPEGNRDGIKLSGLDHFRIDQCVVERWGTGGSGIDLVGCHQGVVTACTFRYQGNLPANGVQTKGGSRDIRIEHCRFDHAGSRGVNIGGSTGLAYFRPKVEGFEARDITVEDCTFVGSSAPICFVGVDGAVVRYNTLYRPERYVLRILQESRGDPFVPSRNGIFSHNLVVFRSEEIRGIVDIGPATAPETFQFAKNHWYCSDRPERSNRIRLPTPERDGVQGGDPLLVDPENGNFTLQPNTPVRDAGARR
jgi:hypothetical protein